MGRNTLYNYLFVKLEELGVHAINKIVDLKEVPSSENEEKQRLFIYISR